MVTKVAPPAAPVVKRTEVPQGPAPVAPQPPPAASEATGWRAGAGNAGKTAGPPLSEADAQRFKQAAEETRRTQAEALARQGGLTVRAGVNGTLGALNQTFDATVGAVVNGAVNLTNRTLGTSIPNLPSTAQSLAGAVDRHLPKPENATERVVQQVASAMAGAGAMGVLSSSVSASSAASSTVRGVAAELSANQSLNVASAAGSAAGSSLTAEAGGGRTAQVVAGLAGGMAPGAISHGVRQARAAAEATRVAGDARKVMSDLQFEFGRPNSSRDPSTLKPLLEKFQQLKANGHVFTKAEERLARQAQEHLALLTPRSAAPAAPAPAATPSAARWSVEQPPRTISRAENRARLAQEETAFHGFARANEGRRVRVVDSDAGFQNADGSWGRTRTLEGVLVGSGKDANNNTVVTLRLPDGKTTTEVIHPRNLTIDVQ